MHSAKADEIEVLHRYLINLTVPHIVQNNSPTTYEIHGLCSTEVPFSSCDLQCLQGWHHSKQLLKPSFKAFTTKPSEQLTRGLRYVQLRISLCSRTQTPQRGAAIFSPQPRLPELPGATWSFPSATQHRAGCGSLILPVTPASAARSVPGKGRGCGGATRREFLLTLFSEGKAAAAGVGTGRRNRTTTRQRDEEEVTQ